jgi:hypothetical protein
LISISELDYISEIFFIENGIVLFFAFLNLVVVTTGDLLLGWEHCFCTSYRCDHWGFTIDIYKLLNEWIFL